MTETTVTDDDISALRDEAGSAGDLEMARIEMFGSDMEWLVRTLAAIYSDHPDYRQEWEA